MAVSIWFTSSFGIFQTSLSPNFPIVPVVQIKDSTFRPLGSMSFITILVDSSGPLFVIFIVYDIFSPVQGLHLQVDFSNFKSHTKVFNFIKNPSLCPFKVSWYAFFSGKPPDTLFNWGICPEKVCPVIYALAFSSTATPPP